MQVRNANVKPKKRKCPRCGKQHNWPTDDNLCKKCEEWWTNSLEHKQLLESWNKL